MKYLYTIFIKFPFRLPLIHYLLIVLVFDIMLSSALVQSWTYKQSNLIRENRACLCVCVGIVVSGRGGVQRGLCFHWLLL